MMFRYIITYTTIVIVLLFIILPIALCASAAMGICTTISKIYMILYETSRELFKVAKVSFEQAKIKTLVAKVIKKNTIDI